MHRLSRILAVTLGLTAAGAAIGFVAGATSLFLALAVTNDISLRFLREMLEIGGAYGAMMGAVAAPLASWLFMRHVPFGRSIAWTTVGTVVGGAVGWTVLASGDQVSGGIYGAVTGFLLAVALVRRRTVEVHESVVSPALLPPDRPSYISRAAQGNADRVPAR